MQRTPMPRGKGFQRKPFPVGTHGTQEHKDREEAKNARARSMMESVRLAPKPSISMGGSTTGPAPKEGMLESATYENAVRDIGRCMRCGRICRPHFCHRDEGKGMGIKTDVREGWAGCGECHYIVGTSGRLPKDERRAEDLRLGALTRAEVLARGTWPKKLPQWNGKP